MLNVNCSHLPDTLKNKTWVIGVSGGTDSLALLHALVNGKTNQSLIVAHLHHGWRPEADDDAEFVRKTAVSLNLPIHIQKTDVPALAAQHNWTLEEAGRNARYQFFADIARKNNTTVIAVAHNADDQAETVLMHLLRGTGTAGLRGMSPIAPLPLAAHHQPLFLIRPLLAVSRADIETYCRTHNLHPRTDATNADTRFLRNRIRHDLLPLLAEYNPQIKAHLQQTAVIANADYAFLSTSAASIWEELKVQKGEGWVSFSLSAWAKRPLAMRRLLLRRAAGEVQPTLPNASFQLFEQARLLAEKGQTGTIADLSAKLRLQISYDRVQITAASITIPHHAPQLPSDELIPIPTPGHLPLGNGWELHAELCVAQAEIGAVTGKWEMITAVSPPFFLRPRRDGERFQPFGMNGRSQSVKKAMINHKIEARLRPLWPIITTTDHILWIAGCCQDERSRVPANTEQLWHLQLTQSGSPSIALL